MCKAIKIFVTLNLSIYAGAKSGTGLLLLEDVTQSAEQIRELNQQRYELMLYKNSHVFRQQFLYGSLLGKSEPIQNVRKMMERLSRYPSTAVLLLGESGTGKSLAARIIHYSANNPNAPFIEVNCAALPENLIESELFGYEKGAFTHAIGAKAGLLEEADGGTLFLDEIGELPINLQAKLLTVIETKRFRRLGSNKEIEVNVRIITATNRDLKEEIAQKKFREDLYFRLHIVAITLPPLRDLGDDILLIARHFLEIYNIEFKRHVKGFGKKAENKLLNHNWPGNVRELCNYIERAMIFADSDYIDETDLVISTVERESEAVQWEVPDGGIDLEEVEKQLLISALKKVGNNKSKAARLLGLTRDTLRYRLEKHQL